MTTLTLRRSRPADAAAVAQFTADESVYPNLLQLPYPSEERWRKVLEDHDAPGSAHMVLVAVEDEQVVGMAGLHPVGLAMRRRHVMYLGISLARHAQGRGVGKALMQALVDYADNWGHVLRLELTVFADNPRAVALYRRFGFETEGVLRAYALRNGAYVDALSMARLHPNPPCWPRANSAPSAHELG